MWWISDDNSDASGWEIAIKTRLGKLRLPSNLEQFVPEQLHLNGVESLPVYLSHALHLYNLPFHRDPFDRLLVAQAQLESLPIVTVDWQIERYAVQVLW